ncbi:MAG: M48 family metallopeptidase [Paracoccaceae bacterium]
MKTATIPGNPPVEITLRKSPRLRRYSLRVSRADGRVTLSLPDWAPEDEALAFARGKADWIRDVLARRAPGSVVEPGGTLPFEGVDLPVVAAPVRSPRVQDGALLVPQSGDTARRVAAFLKLAARDRISPAVDHYVGAVGRPCRDLVLRDTRSRWGSCSVDGRLMFSWRLVMAPPEVLDYVVAHEVAHLVEMNHSPAFWAVVARICPDYKRHRSWLARRGQRLQAIRFGD